MKTTRASERQKDLLYALNMLDGHSDGYGPIWERYGGAFEHFDRVADKCLAKGFITKTDEKIRLTPLGARQIGVPPID